MTTKKQILRVSQVLFFVAGLIHLVWGLVVLSVSIAYSSQPSHFMVYGYIVCSLFPLIGSFFLFSKRAKLVVAVNFILSGLQVVLILAGSVYQWKAKSVLRLDPDLLPAFITSVIIVAVSLILYKRSIRQCSS